MRNSLILASKSQSINAIQLFSTHRCKWIRSIPSYIFILYEHNWCWVRQNCLHITDFDATVDVVVAIMEKDGERWSMGVKHENLITCLGKLMVIKCTIVIIVEWKEGMQKLLFGLGWCNRDVNSMKVNKKENKVPLS